MCDLNLGPKLFEQGSMLYTAAKYMRESVTKMLLLDYSGKMQTNPELHSCKKQ